MEVSVSFADKDSLYYIERGYTEHKSELGKVYIQEEHLETTENITIRYEKHPWLECFEIDGAKPKPIKRKGYGTKDAKGFVQSLSSIYAKAYQDYLESNNDAEFFTLVAENFVRSLIEDDETKMFRKFCGFTENMWREGNKEMHDIAMNNMLPFLVANKRVCENFQDSITDEFKIYIEKAKEISL